MGCQNVFSEVSNRDPSIISDPAPWMVEHLCDIESLRHVAIEHISDEVDAVIADCVRHPQIAVHDLVNTVEWIFLVDDGVQKDTQRPNVLFLAVVGLAC